MIKNNQPPNLDLSIVIVNFNTLKYLETCINSIKTQCLVNYEVIVVDNCSQPSEQKDLLLLENDVIKIIQLAQNIGFGRANNEAVKYARGEYLLILNPDTTLISPKTLSILIGELNVSGAAMLAPLISEKEKRKWVTPKNSYPAQRLCKYTNFERLPGNIAWTLGACFIMRKKHYEAIGGFDEDFFMYGEDIDICLRTRKSLGEIRLTKSVVVEHIGGASEKSSEDFDKWVRKRRGLFLFFKKNYDHRDFKKICTIKKINSLLNLYILLMADAFKKFIFRQVNKSPKIVRLKATLEVIKEFTQYKAE